MAPERLQIRQSKNLYPSDRKLQRIVSVGGPIHIDAHSIAGLIDTGMQESGRCGCIGPGREDLSLCGDPEQLSEVECFILSSPAVGGGNQDVSVLEDRQSVGCRELIDPVDVLSGRRG